MPQKSTIKILMATHKKVEVPKSDIYFPIQVGSYNAENLYYQSDHAGENISEKNPYYSELTGLYWAWKNLDVDYIGLVHYRRYFSTKRYSENKSIDELIMSKEQLQSYLSKASILVPKKRNYYIETLYSHYANTFDAKHLDLTRVIIEEQYPDYLDSFDFIMKEKSGYMFNMYVMKKSLSDDYCNWLFDILFSLEEQINFDSLSAFEARLLGRVSELLLNVWLHKQNETIIEIPYLHAFKVNWFKKGTSFLMSKLFKKKYKKSF